MEPAVAMSSGEVTGDGIQDLVVLTGRTVELIHFHAARPSGFAHSRTALGSYSSSLAVADLDARGGDEIVVADGERLVVLSVLPAVGGRAMA